MNQFQANLCLICVTLLWSTEVIIFACIPDSVVPFATTAITSLIGAALLALCFFKRIKAALKAGGIKLLLIGIFLSALNCGYNVMYLYGLKQFDVSTGAFTISMTVVVLPVIMLMKKKNVDMKTWLSAGLVLVGILVSYIGKIGEISIMGLLIMIVGCIIRAFYIIRLNEFARAYDPVPISAMIAFFVGVYSLIIWFCIQPETFAAIEWNTQIIASLLGFVLASSSTTS